MTEKPLILIVDDSEDYAEILASKLRAAGFTIAMAKDGREGIAAARTFHPLVIILDVQMPNMDGITALTELRKDKTFSKTNIFLISSYVDPQQGEYLKEEQLAKSRGATDFLSKSMDLDEITKTVTRN